MAKRSEILFWSILLILCCTRLALAQADDLDQTINEYTSAFTLGPLIWTLLWSLAYLPIYAGGLVIPMIYLQRFTGTDANLLFWIALLWLGGLGANYVGYAVGGTHRWLAVLIAAVIIFGWVVLICTRSWADLSLRESLIVAAVITILCAPYLGPTWRIERVKKPVEESRTHLYPVAGHYTRSSLPDPITQTGPRRCNEG